MSKSIVHAWLDDQVTSTDKTIDSVLVIKVDEQHYKLSMKYLTKKARKVMVMKGAAKVATQRKELEADFVLLAKEKERITALLDELHIGTKSQRSDLLEELGERACDLQKREKILADEKFLVRCMQDEITKERKQVGLDFETTKDIQKTLRDAEVVAANANAIFNHAEDMVKSATARERKLDKLEKKLERRFDAVEGFMTGNLRVAVKQLIGE